jgi:hypothetical protein
MNITRKTRISEDGEIASKESKMKIRTSNLIRWSGLAAMAGGIIFAGIQPIHPPDVLASVTTGAWALIITLKWVMALFFLIGISGIYARQVNQAGWLGLAGYLMLIISWWLQTAYVFTELFILPVMATPAPEFVDSFLGIVNGTPGEMNIGALPAVYDLSGIMYVLGGVLFGIATFRASILPRGAAVLLAVGAALTPLAVLLPHALQRYAAVPVGLAIAWLGLALFSERREPASDPCPDLGSPQLSHTGAD